MNIKTNRRWIVLILIPALLLAACSAPSALVSTLSNAGSNANAAAPAVVQPAALAVTPAPVNVAPSGSLASFESTFEQIYQKVNPSVVSIDVIEGASATSSNNQSPFGNQNPFGFNNPNNPNNQGQVPQSEALGSGFVWDTQGHIVTNNHVVAGATRITVTFADGTTVDAKLVGADPNSDLAVIQVPTNATTLVPVEVADSTQVKVGQVAIAIGNPYGLSNTMTEGIISALSRTLPVQSNSNSNSTNGALTGGSYTIPDIIQTDAAINPGNSGGVLLNDQGQLIGVTAAIESGSQSNSGIGFVIPSAIVNKVVPSLIQTGTIKFSWLGISGTTLTPDLNSANNLPANQKGALVVSVTSGGPAANAGLQGSNQQSTVSGQQVPTGGDVITAVNGQAVTTFDDLTAYLFLDTKPGQTVTLTVLRQGQQQNLSVTLGERPAQ